MRYRAWLMRLLAFVAVLAIALAFPPRRTGQSEVILRQTRAVSQVRLIHTAETQYYSQGGRYAVTLRELAAVLDDNRLDNATQDGYRFIVIGTRNTYQVMVSPDKSVGRSFYSDQTMIVRFSDDSSPATAASPELK